MVHGVSGYSSYGSQPNDNLTPFQRNQLKDVLNELQQLMMNTSIYGLSGINIHNVEHMKEQVESILNAKPPPSPKLASQCEQVINNLNAIIKDKESDNLSGCMKAEENATDIVSSALS